jgi:nitrite reductase/ring-hydroxylating ferredoxin subunit
LHGRRFDLETGVPVRASEPSCLAIFPTRVEDGIILVNLRAGHKAIDDAAA